MPKYKYHILTSYSGLVPQGLNRCDKPQGSLLVSSQDDWIKMRPSPWVIMLLVLCWCHLCLLIPRLSCPDLALLLYSVVKVIEPEKSTNRHESRSAAPPKFTFPHRVIFLSNSNFFACATFSAKPCLRQVRGCGNLQSTRVGYDLDVLYTLSDKITNLHVRGDENFF